MNVLTFLDGRNEPTDVGAVLDRRVTLGEIDEGDLVPDRHVLLCGQLKIAVVFSNDAEQLSARLDTLDNDDADVVLLIVN
jgi:hypothetical protein